MTSPEGEPTSSFIEARVGTIIAVAAEIKSTGHTYIQYGYVERIYAPRDSEAQVHVSLIQAVDKQNGIPTSVGLFCPSTQWNSDRGTVNIPVVSGDTDRVLTSRIIRPNEIPEGLAFLFRNSQLGPVQTLRLAASA